MFSVREGELANERAAALQAQKTQLEDEMSSKAQNHSEFQNTLNQILHWVHDEKDARRYVLYSLIMKVCVKTDRRDVLFDV